MSESTLLLGFADYREPAQRLAQAAGFAYAEVEVHRFPDGESRVRLPANLPGRVVLCRSLDQPNDKLLELELTAATARQLGVTELVLVAPYLCYMRQDIAFHPGEAVSQRIVGDKLARCFDGLITVDPHLHRTPCLQDAVPVAMAVSLTAAVPLAQALAQRQDSPLLLGPDEESAQWVQVIGERAGLDYAVAHKERLGDSQVRVSLPDVDLSGRPVVLVDDMASTGRTLAAAARAARARGATRVDVMVTHALFVGDALAVMAAAGVDDILSTDSVCHSSNRVGLAELLAEALV